MRKYLYIKIKNDNPFIIKDGEWHNQSLDQYLNIDPSMRNYKQKLKEAKDLRKIIKMTEESNVLYVQTSIQARLDYKDKEFIVNWAKENNMRNVVFGNIKRRSYINSGAKYNYEKQFK